MNYKEFKETIMDLLCQRYPEEQYEVSLRRVTKNNGVLLDGVCIFPKDVNMTPTIYLNGYYEQYREGETMADILHGIQEEFNYGMEMTPTFISIQSGYKAIRSQIIMRLINYEKNAEILQECPYIPFHDLAITFRWLAHQDDIGISTALITNRDMERWGIDKSQLYQDACRNTPKIFPYRFSRMKDMMKEHGMETDSALVELYIVTNEQGMNGATCILYQNVLEEVAAHLKCNFYLLPSSIHEMMICPDDGPITRELLLSLVKEANHMVVTMGEVLSDNIYYYDSETGLLSFLKQNS